MVDYVISVILVRPELYSLGVDPHHKRLWDVAMRFLCKWRWFLHQKLIVWPYNKGGLQLMECGYLDGVYYYLSLHSLFI